jgi:hypothetical protein
MANTEIIEMKRTDLEGEGKRKLLKGGDDAYVPAVE